MSDIKITIKNLAQIKKAFKQSPIIMTKNLNIAIRKSVTVIERDSKKNTPVLTGRLRSSHRQSFSNLRGEVGTNVDYDVFVHDGTKFMKARPFLYNAVVQNERDIDRFFTEAVQKTLETIGSNT